MASSLRKLTARRSGHRCEYCRLHEADLPGLPFHLEHVISRKHGGSDEPGNTAWSCQHCNLFKGSDLAGRDTLSGRVARLFNPRRQKWSRHFRWNGPVLVGLTSTGRATIAVLRLNAPYRIEIRTFLITTGAFPPP
jgi:hypothetical protein